MKACVDAVTTPAIIPRLPSIISSVIDSVKTDLSLRQMLEFIGTLRESQAKGLRTDMVPGRPLYIDEVSYWIPNMSELRRSMASTLGVTLSPAERSRMERAIREYEDSIPANATELPAGDTSVGRAVSADEALGKSDRAKDTDDADAKSPSGKSGKQRTGSDASGTRSTRGEGSAAPQGRSGDASAKSSDTGRHASTRAGNGSSAGGEGTRPSAGGAPTRGAAAAGKQQ